LTHTKYVDNPDENEIIFGKNAVTEFLKSSGKADVLYLSSLSEDKSHNYIAALAVKSGVVIKRVHPQKLIKLCGSDRHQGVAVACSGHDYCDVDAIFSRARQLGQAPFIIITDGIEDPHNLGAIIRTALCAGAHGVIIPNRRGCLVTAAVHRASAGACSHILISKVVNVAAEIREIKKRGVFCYCAEAGGELCYDADLTGPAALVVGSEGSGVSRLVKELCDKTISVPMSGEVNSLNASVAAGILMYEFVRQNRQQG